MRLACLLLCVSATAGFAANPPSENAVEAQKKKFDQLRQSNPLWPEKIRPRARHAILPEVKAPVLVAEKEQERPRVCSVPLTNVVRPSDPQPPMPQYRPQTGGDAMPQVQLPAPPCDDMGK